MLFQHAGGRANFEMKVISVNVGMPRQVMWKGAAVWTGIFKQAVEGPKGIKQLNLEGDAQADLNNHGGIPKAVYGYPIEHYEYWREQLPGVALTWGHFGENLTTEGLFEKDVCIGDRLRIGSAVLMVTQPRIPCYKLGIRFGRDDMAARFLASARSGFYFSVVEPGEVTRGSEIEIVHRDGNRVSVAEIGEVYRGENKAPELLDRIAQLTALPKGLKAELFEAIQD
jgi:MOSC domain-containing protein YiiM